MRYKTAYIGDISRMQLVVLKCSVILYEDLYFSYFFFTVETKWLWVCVKLRGSIFGVKQNWEIQRIDNHKMLRTESRVQLSCRFECIRSDCVDS